MINPTFQFVIDKIARRLLDEPDFYDSLPLIGCDVKTWPSCLAKNVATQYEVYRKEGDHKLALLKLWDSAEPLLDQDFPEDPTVFRHIYAEAFKKQQVDVLRWQLARDPMAAEKYIAQFNAGIVETEVSHVGFELDATLNAKKRLIQAGKSQVAIPGFEELSNAISGFNPARVGMLLAQTGFGKTTCAINLSHRAASIMPVLYINMEMSEQDFHERLLCSIERITLKEFDRIIMQDPDRVEKLRSKVVPMPLHFTRGKTMSTSEIFSIAMQHKNKNGLGLLVIDNDQKIALKTSKDTPEWKALQQTLEGLDELSKKLECFILVLAQESADGDVSGSRRSKFPASSVIRFFEDKDALIKPRYVLKLLKNRYGKQNQEIEVQYDGSRYAVDEIKSQSVSAKQKYVGDRIRERKTAPPHTTRRDAFGD